MTKSKRCPKCEETKPLTDFYKDKSRKDGYEYICKTCRKARNVQSYEDNREGRIAHMVQYKRENRGVVLEQERRHNRKHPEVHRAARIRYFTARGYEDFPTEIVKEVIAVSGGICPYCDKPFTGGHIDHVIPVSKGGTNDRKNLAYVCARCNLSKGNKNLDEFLA